MQEPGEYRRTLLDRHGPDGILLLPVFGLGIFVAAVIAGGLHLLVRAWWDVPVALAGGCLVGAIAWYVTQTTGGAVAHVMTSGASTPSADQFSYQDALVMRGEIDDAIASLEAIVAEQPDAIRARIKAAELHIRHRVNYARAAELFRGALQRPNLSLGDEVYVTHRLADLLSGPLDQPGRALVELRRLIDRHPNSPAAEQARASLATLKSRLHPDRA
jgi:hypothetical protein